MKRKISAFKSRIPPTSELVDIARSGRRFPAAVLKWAQREFIWGLLIVPVLFVALVYSLCDANFLGWRDSDVFKPLMEIVHPALLAGFLLLSLVSWRLTRDISFCFLMVLSIFVLARELIGQGSTFVLYAAIIGLILYGRHNPQGIGSLLRSRWATSFLGMCFLCYLSSQLLDRGIVKRIGWLILWDTSWKLPYSSNLEEALESLGGFFLLCTPFAVNVGRMTNSSITTKNTKVTEERSNN
jgi:hypothetical protein